MERIEAERLIKIIERYKDLCDRIMELNAGKEAVAKIIKEQMEIRNVDSWNGLLKSSL